MSNMVKVLQIKMREKFEIKYKHIQYLNKYFNF
jgi:hypothetical protein